ncbi:hypothetical protein QR680_002852 [Steinernema hermaphroditum]|uniref:Phosphoserine phosphatase n=1 Tax=Steinernema hermaphroditum TaxID=289476 RepID=A0AA39H4B7_9BILA|nr:hypothetical protein QR680_002852 [Steinernema hermaphroditum]
MRPELLRFSQLPQAAAHAAKARFATETGRSMTESHVRDIWFNADAVCFDVDSTVCTDEAIDELAAFVGVGDEVARCTHSAMNGNVSFREALRMRLDIMKPSYEQLETYALTHTPRLTQGIRELVDALHSRNVDVYLVSGGFRRLIRPVADLLKIDHDRIFANEILFDEFGNYDGFDDTEPTSESGSKSVGKAGVCGLLKRKMGYKTLVMVGDGATDAEACPPADAFIGFGGNQARDSVRRLAGWYVYDFKTLTDALNQSQ